jgi:ubiquinone biosynthesis protein
MPRNSAEIPNLLGERTVSLTSLPGLSGYTIATFLGIWLIIAIFRSGRM